MNRVLLVEKRDPGLEDLKETARIIYLNIVKGRNSEFISKVFKSLAVVYFDLKTLQNQKHKVDIFGLRDFYNFIKNVANGIKSIENFENLDKKKENKIRYNVLMGINRNYSFQRDQIDEIWTNFLKK